jgi:hypothetical protein
MLGDQAAGDVRVTTAARSSTTSRNVPAKH